MRIATARLLSLPLLFVSILPAAGDEPPSQEKPRKTRVVFSAMGDVPYTPAEDELLPRQIAELPARSEFAVHVGDIKKGASVPCTEEVYQKVAGMLAKSTPRLFIIPGDNEWNDCTDPDEGWQNWVKHFQRFDERWSPSFPVFRQLEREENFSFVRGGVLFIAINVVGGRVHDADEWKHRHAQNLEWVRRNLRRFGKEVASVVVFGHANPNPKRHGDFFEPFVEEALRFEKPILYLHGDGHRWIHDRPFAAKNLLRVQVDAGGIAPPVMVTITDDPVDPFVFDRRKAD